jgi:hypothetical protein
MRKKIGDLQIETVKWAPIFAQLVVSDRSLHNFHNNLIKAPRTIEAHFSSYETSNKYGHVTLGREVVAFSSRCRQKSSIIIYIHKLICKSCDIRIGHAYFSSGEVRIPLSRLSLNSMA